jgi:drug/metabolite transporter (DMT)-like permease
LLWLVPFQVPPAGFWPWMAVLLPLEVAAMLLYMTAIRDHALALTLPYLAFTPVLVVVTGWLLLGEQVTGAGLAGVLLVVAGSWQLNAEQARWGDWHTWSAPWLAIVRHAGSRRMLAAAALYSLTSVLGKGALQYLPALSFGALYFLLLGLVTSLGGQLREPGLVRRVWRRPGAVLLVGVVHSLMVVTHFLAVAQVEVAYMIAVKRTSLLFGLLYGALCFGEDRLGAHLLGAALMLAGVGLILS